MRIPSQFNDDNLYRRDPHRYRSTGAYRRLIRLSLGLALVVVVMRQASRPAVYRPFFGSATTTAHTSGTQTTGGPSARNHTSSVPPSHEDQQIAMTLASELAPSDQRKWAIVLAKGRQNGNVESIPSTDDSLRLRLVELAEATPETKKTWNRAFDSLSDSSLDDESTRSCLAALSWALETEAMSEVVDGSVWQGADFDAFYQFLINSDLIEQDTCAAVGVVPLLQQPGVYRGTRVTVSGMVARAEHRTTTRRDDADDANEYGIHDYWQLWIRPSDGADRPLVAIVREVPPSIAEISGAELSSSGTTENGPEVVVAGKFLKRLTYRSSVGAELAPVIVGRVARSSVTMDVVAVNPPIQNGTATRLWWTILLSALSGITLAVVVMWRSSVAAKRTRQLRASLPDETKFF